MKQKSALGAMMMLLMLVVFCTAIFFINDGWVMTMIFAALMIITLLLNNSKSALSKCLKFLLKNLGFVIFVVLCNLIFSDKWTAVMVGVRLFLAILAVYNVSQVLSPRQFAEGMGLMMRPLAFFGMDVDGAVLTITVALNLIPVLTREAVSVSRALELKGVKKSFVNVFRRPQIYVRCYLASLFRRATEMERALLLKGYGE